MRKLQERIRAAFGKKTPGQPKVAEAPESPRSDRRDVILQELQEQQARLKELREWGCIARIEFDELRRLADEKRVVMDYCDEEIQIATANIVHLTQEFQSLNSKSHNDLNSEKSDER